MKSPPPPSHKTWMTFPKLSPSSKGLAKEMMRTEGFEPLPPPSKGELHRELRKPFENLQNPTQMRQSRYNWSTYKIWQRRQHVVKGDNWEYPTLGLIYNYKRRDEQSTPSSCKQRPFIGQNFIHRNLFSDYSSGFVDRRMKHILLMDGLDVICPRPHTLHSKTP